MTIIDDEPHDAETLHKLLVTLWSKAVNQPHYEKAEWIMLQQCVFVMQGQTPVENPQEPEPWELNGNGRA